MSKVILHTKFDDGEGRIGWKNLLILCFVILAFGGILIFGINTYILNKPHIFEGKVITVEDNSLVSLEIIDNNEHSEHNHSEFAKNTHNIKLEPGDIVSVQSTEEGNIILEVQED